MSNQITASFRRAPEPDFARSEIIHNGPGIADGRSELIVVVQLMNSDGSVVKLFRPIFEIVSGEGVTAFPCTTSNENGVSTCVLKAIKAGTKRIAVTNITISLQTDVVFQIPPVGQGLMAISASGLVTGERRQTSGTHSLTATISTTESEAVKTSGRFKLFGGVQGEAFSR